MIKLDTQYTHGLLSDRRIKAYYQSKLKKVIKHLRTGDAEGADMTGWINYCARYSKDELQAMVKKAKEWQKSGIKKVVVIGIGGSYLGIRAGIEMLHSEFDNKNFKIYYAHNFNHNYLTAMLDGIKNDPFGIIMISKSGNTLEPAVALQLFRERLVKNVGEKKSNELIVAVTDRRKGTLHDLAKAKKWTSFVIPDNVGGRYSALTPAGMFLFILLGLDYKRIIQGSIDAGYLLKNPDLDKNDAFKYAAYRHYFKTFRRLDVENFVVYDPGLEMIGEVYKQLFGESEGKKHKALYPVTSLFTTDLHSMGQYLQEGTRNFFETVLYIKQPIKDTVLNIRNNEANIKYLNGMSISYLNKVAMQSTVKAHFLEGKVDNLIIYLDKQDAYHFGYLYTWMCFAAMASAYLHKLNPFDQPGVEVYKKRISTILNRKSRKHYNRKIQGK